MKLTWSPWVSDESRTASTEASIERPDTARMREKERHGLEERVMVWGSLPLSLPTGHDMTLATIRDGEF